MRPALATARPQTSRRRALILSGDPWESGRKSRDSAMTVGGPAGEFGWAPAVERAAGHFACCAPTPRTTGGLPSLARAAPLPSAPGLRAPQPCQAGMSAAAAGEAPAQSQGGIDARFEFDAPRYYDFEADSPESGGDRWFDTSATKGGTARRRGAARALEAGRLGSAAAGPTCRRRAALTRAAAAACRPGFACGAQACGRSQQQPQASAAEGGGRWADVAC